LFSVSREVIKHSDAFLLHLPADVENFSELDQGYLLAEDVAQTRWVIEEEGARIIFSEPEGEERLARRHLDRADHRRGPGISLKA
jgi:succinylglutamate desuccinylase